MTDDTEFYDHPSRSRLKRDAEALQDLGKTLVQLPQRDLDKVPMPEHLAAAVAQARSITSHGALRRQLQYIGKLMREIDAEPIRVAVENLRQFGQVSAAKFHAIERWRDRFIEEGDTALTAFLSAYPQADRQQLRQLIQNARRERDLNKPPAAARRLFKLLREILEPEA